MKKTLIAGLIAFSASANLYAANYHVEVLNLTRGMYFTPLVISAHPAGVNLFSAGMPASTSIQQLAEGGSISGVSLDMANAGAKTVENPAGGLLAPGMSIKANLGMPSQANTHLSIAAMMLPCNDCFVALNALMLPTTKGTYTYMLNAYDAGTEANDEIRGGGAPGVPGMPVPPPLENQVGMGGTGIVGATAEGYVHIHRGPIGDTNPTGGQSDMNAAAHRWLNPVARVTVTVE